MKLLDTINLWIKKMRHKRTFSLLRNDNLLWRANLSPAMIVTIGVAVVTIIMGILLVLVAYTPLLDIMPGYRTNAVRSREMLIQSVARVDSLERRLNQMLAYNENRILVVGGKTPALHSPKNDSLQRAKEYVAPSKADSLLRHKMENDERYRLNTVQPTQNKSDVLNAVTPMSGIISDRFNSNDLHGIRIKGGAGEQVSSIADGTVLLTEWLPESGHCVVVQHKGNFISLYRNLSNVLVTKGAQVKGTQAIGYATNDKNKEVSTLEFELWSDGKAVNPELYIVF
jgi:septal ring factor EnvC (AmiA/AmiB activator)